MKSSRTKSALLTIVPGFVVLATSLAAFLAGSFAYSSAAQPARDTRPNILLIVAEDMSSRVNAFGDHVAMTPAIDVLASEGIRYANVFTTSGVCAPSRSALITGVYQTSMGTHQMRTYNIAGVKGPVANYHAVPPAEVKAFPELMRRAGYATANLAKMDYQFGEPFTVWDLHSGNFSAPPDLALWRKLPQDKPFFVMLNLMSTHESRLFPVDFAGETKMGAAIKKMATMRAKMVKAVTDPNDVNVPPYYPDTPQVRASIAQHYDNIRYMDTEVRRILANLQSDGLSENTIVIWTTDHGDGLPRAKRAVYDSGLQVPLIIRYPDKFGAGSIREELVSFVDLAPAILGLAGIELPQFIQGHDFLNSSGREYVYAARDRMDAVPDRVRAVRDKRFKYIRNYTNESAYFRPLQFRDMFPVMQALWAGHKKGTLAPSQAFYFTAPRPVEELYDTVLDPHEVNNLATDLRHEKTLTRLRTALDDWITKVGDKGDIAEADMIQQMWPNGKQPITAAPRATSRSHNNTCYVSLESATEGASIGYRILDNQKDAPWLVYSQPVQLLHAARLEAKAIRYGFAESAVTVFDNTSPRGPE